MNETPPVGLSMRVPAEITEPTLAIIIERMIRDQSVDMSRVTEALQLYERITARKAKQEFDTAFPAMAAEIPVVERKGSIDIGRGKPQTYAKIEDIVEAVTPVLSRHGFHVRFRLAQSEKTVTATCVLTHAGGHSEETPFTIPHDVSGSKNIVQAIGSAKSYAQRYALLAALNVVSRDADDDGPRSSDEFFVTEAQAAELVKMVEQTGRPLELFCKKYRLAAIGELPASQYQEALAFLANHIPKDDK
jgi:ERF superfamily